MRSANEELKRQPGKKDEATEARVDNLWNALDDNDIEIVRLQLDYARKHPYSRFAFEAIQGQVNRYAGMAFYDEYEAVYAALTPEIKNSEHGIEFKAKLDRFKASKVGSVAPSIVGKDKDGVPFSLSDLRGKYLLVDFWASWCAPCREELSYIKVLYETYNARGFEVLSVTLDENPDAWTKAIDKEKIGNWKHFSIPQNNSDAKTNYFVNGIPHKVLIDPNGVIVGKWKGGGRRNKQQLEQQLHEIFK
ncbi:MAG: TlpA family protein disulfide reductase [Proteobacteria bacterium]|nr:MAG: TlpA family protein disulfide reductase [Pseudomonadota bacterium]